MPFQPCQGRGASLVANATAPPGGPLQGVGTLPLCSLLYYSWGGAPPFGAADMQMYERWRCRTLALRSLSSLSSGSAEVSCAGTAVPASGAPSDKLDRIEEEEARRAEGFALLRRCLPTDLPMDLVERTAWTECLSYFCKRESSRRFRNGNSSSIISLEPVSLPSLVARLAHRLWFLLPGGAHFFSASSGGAGLLEVLPPWVSFFCEELAAFFLFVLLHMRAIIKAEHGVYVHLTDREWSARFRQLKWLLSVDCLPPSPFTSVPLGAQRSTETEKVAEAIATENKKGSAFPFRGEEAHIDFPPVECIDTSLSEHFPMNPQSAPHSFWLLFDRRSLSWVVCTESYALRSFPVLNREGDPRVVPSEEASTATSDGSPSAKQKKKPLPSLVDAAREDALRFLCLLGAVPPGTLSGNTNYLYSLQSEAEFAEGVPLLQQQQSLPCEAAHDWVDANPMHSEVDPMGGPSDGPVEEDRTRGDFEGSRVADAYPPEEATKAVQQLQALLPVLEEEEVGEVGGPLGWPLVEPTGEPEGAPPLSGSSRQGEHRAASDIEKQVQALDGPLSPEDERSRKTSAAEGNPSTRALQKRQGRKQEPQDRRKRRKRQEQQREQHQERTQKEQRPQQEEEQQEKQRQQQQQPPGLQRLLDGLLQGGKKEFCGGRVLVGLRHRNGLLDARLVAFCRSYFSGNKVGNNNEHLTEPECVAAVQGYMQQHCERQKKIYVCDDKLRLLTGKERLPHQREALAKALKTAGLIEHFMIDPRDLKDACTA